MTVRPADALVDRGVAVVIDAAHPTMVATVTETETGVTADRLNKAARFQPENGSSFSMLKSKE